MKHKRLFAFLLLVGAIILLVRSCDNAPVTTKRIQPSLKAVPTPPSPKKIEVAVTTAEIKEEAPIVLDREEEYLSLFFTKIGSPLIVKKMLFDSTDKFFCLGTNALTRCQTQTKRCVLEQEKTKQETSFCIASIQDCLEDIFPQYLDPVVTRLWELGKTNPNKAAREFKKYLSENDNSSICESVKNNLLEEPCETPFAFICSKDSELTLTPAGSTMCESSERDKCVNEVN